MTHALDPDKQARGEGSLPAAPFCPICGANRFTIWHTVSISDLSRLYRDSIQIDICDLFRPAAELRLLRCPDCDLGFFDPMVAGGQGFYEHLQQLDWYYPKTKSEFVFAAKFIDREHDVLEIGCGEGRFAEHIRARSFVGLEYTDAAVERARARGLNVERASIESYSERRAHSADVVCAFQVLEHVPSPRAFVEAALRTLRSGGWLIISVPSADRFIGMAINNILNFPPHHVTWWSDDALRRLADRFGLRLEALEHEQLADEHVEGYLYALWIRSFDRPGREANVIDLSGRVRLLHRSSRLVVPILKRGFRNPALRPDGHTVTAVYRTS